MKNKKKEISSYEELEEVRYASEIDAISKANAHVIRNVYLTYVGDGHICLTCPSSISHALKKIKEKFPEQVLDEIETRLDIEFKKAVNEKVKQYINGERGEEKGETS